MEGEKVFGEDEHPFTFCTTLKEYGPAAFHCTTTESLLLPIVAIIFPPTGEGILQINDGSFILELIEYTCAEPGQILGLPMMGFNLGVSKTITLCTAIASQKLAAILAFAFTI